MSHSPSAAGSISPSLGFMDTSTGSVAMQVSRLNNPVRTGSVPLSRHGIAEHGRRSRQHSREGRRQSSGSQRPTVTGRTTPIGPMEAVEWTDALQYCNDRIDALERTNRMLAQTLAQVNAENNATRSRVSDIFVDVENYKLFISSVHSNMEKVVTHKLGEHATRLDALTNALSSMPNTDAIALRVQSLELMIQQLVMNGGASQPRDGTFNVATPQPSPGGLPEAAAPMAASPLVNESAMLDPWYQAASQLPGSQLPGRMAPSVLTGAAESNLDVSLLDVQPGNVHFQMPTQLPTPSVPSGFEGYGRIPTGPQSPFNQGGAGYETPELRPSGGLNSGSPFGQGPHPGQTGGMAGVSAWADGKRCIYEICRKPNSLLFAFTENISDFQMWVDRITDHVCRSTQAWRPLLEYISKTPTPIRKSWLATNNVTGINAWDVAQILESFCIDWCPKTMYRRRIALCGGELGNGFEFWRLLHLHYRGGTDAVEFGGVRRLQEYPRCADVKKVSEHLDDWLEVLSTYGSELEHCPKMLRSMVMATIPKVLEDELMTKPEHTRSYQEIVAWCRTKCQVIRTRELADFTRRPGAPSSRVNALGQPDTSEFDPFQASAGSTDMYPLPATAQQAVAQEPPWVGKLLAAVRQPQRGRSPPKAPTGAGAQRPAKRGTTPIKRPEGFTFNGCWHCGDEGHSRSGGRDGKGKKCPLFAKYLQENNKGVTDRKKMKLPSTYQGKYEKALIAAGGTPRRLSMLTDENNVDSDDESDFGSPLGAGRCFALIAQSDEPTAHAPTPTPVSNSFAALASEDLEQEAIVELSQWAHKVNKISKPSPKTKVDVFDRISIHNEAELKQVMSDHPTFAALPDQKKLRKMLRQKPIELECGPDEVLCLVDSGSTVHAAWIEKHFPGYADKVMPTAKSLAGDHATTAGGLKLYNKGRVEISASAGGQDFHCAFKDMEVELPILSVRKIVKRRNKVEFADEGGTITHNDSGAVMRFFEHEGVYFLKLKVHDPDVPSQQLGFSRQGQA